MRCENCRKKVVKGYLLRERKNGRRTLAFCSWECVVEYLEKHRERLELLKLPEEKVVKCS